VKLEKILQIEMKKYRIEKQLSPTELADRAGLGRVSKNWNRIESGLHSPTLKTVQRIFDLIGVKIGVLK
jgi:transcriptional regulator with XRE-family HTH domain